MCALRLSALGATDAAAITRWRYPAPYDVYDVGPEDAPGLTDPACRYWAVHRDGDLIAYACLGAEARVRGLEASSDTEDLGAGLRPDLMGQGVSRRLLPWLLSTLADQISADRVRVVILDWNARSLAAYRRAGFADVGRHVNEDGTYLLLEQPAPGR